MSDISVYASEWENKVKVIRYNNLKLTIPFNENIVLTDGLLEELYDSLFYSTYTEKELKDLKQTIEKWINKLNNIHELVVEHITEGDFKQDV